MALIMSNDWSDGGVRMSLEAIKEISDAEEKARISKVEAAVISKKLLSEAEEEGRRSVDDARRKAEDEIHDLKLKVEEKVASDAKELARKTENQKASMLVKAESRMDMAVSLVTERIVNG